MAADQHQPREGLRLPDPDPAAPAAFDFVMAEACGRLATLFADPRMAADPIAAELAADILTVEDMPDLEAAVDRLGARFAEIVARERPRPAASLGGGARARLHL